MLHLTHINIIALEEENLWYILEEKMKKKKNKSKLRSCNLLPSLFHPSPHRTLWISTYDLGVGGVYKYIHLQDEYRRGIDGWTEG